MLFLHLGKLRFLANILVVVLVSNLVLTAAGHKYLKWLLLYFWFLRLTSISPCKKVQKSSYFNFETYSTVSSVQALTSFKECKSLRCFKPLRRLELFMMSKFSNSSRHLHHNRKRRLRQRGGSRQTKSWPRR